MGPITRRDFLGGAAKSGILGAGALIAVRGGLSNASSSRATPAPASTVKARHGGTLTAALTGGSSADTVDPNKPATNPDFARIASLYDGVVWGGKNGLPYLRVVDELAPNKDATTWTMRLRKGVLFHNGREATADDLIFSIRRCVTPSPGVAAILLRKLKLAEIRKVDKYTVSIPFSRPYSTFFEALDGTSTVYLLPEDFDPKHPIGTGPFKYVSFTPGVESVFRRWENYWDQPLPYVDELVLVDYSDESSQVNALLSGQANCVNSVPFDLIDSLKSSGKKVEISPGGGWNPFTMRVDKAPFTDVRVRQAFQLIVDRRKMLESVYGGYGTIGNDIFGIWDPEYDHALPQHEQDIPQAKALLKAAGHEGLTVELVTGDIAQGVLGMAEVFAQQASLAGVKVNLNQITPTEYFGPNYLQWTFAQDYWYYAPILAQVPDNTIPGAPFNETHFDDARYNTLFSQALATLNASTKADIVHEMQKVLWTQAPYIIPFFLAVIDGYAPDVHGAVPSKTGISFNGWDFRSLWLS